MEIVILDAHTANPGDLGWEAMEKLGKLTVYASTRPEEIVNRAVGKEVIVINKVGITAEMMDQLPALKLIAFLATGYNTVDIDAARERNILVCNAPAYGTASVAQHAFALILELTNQVGIHHQSVSAGEWTTQPFWTYRKTPMNELEGKTMGIIGLGNIGSRAAKIALAFGMEVIAHTRTPKHIPGVELVDEDDIFRRSDVISLHCPLTSENFEFVNEDKINLMKSSAFLINTGRGQLIDEAALAKALKNKRIAGAGLDVLSEEPPPLNHPLTGLENCIITPHNAWGTIEARNRLIGIVAGNIRAFREGSPRNVVNL